MQGVYESAEVVYEFGIMDERGSEQLEKILALADSSHESEALVAVRKARQMLSRDGLSFGALARAAAAQQFKSSSVFSFLTGGREVAETQNVHLRQQVEDLKSQMQTQDFQMDFWKRRVAELEQSCQHAQTEAERWKKLASETADRLWEIARTVGGENFHSASPAAAPEKKAGRKKK